MTGRALKVALTGALAAGAVVVGIGPAPVAQATQPSSYVVNSILDEPHDPAFPGQCVSTPSGVCTLRAALEAGPHAAGELERHGHRAPHQRPRPDRSP